MAVANPYQSLVDGIAVREDTVPVLGSSTAYWTYGPEDAATTIVAVHGFRGEHHGLEPVVAHLAGLRVISPDLPGFGASTPMTEAAHDVTGYGRWLRAFLDSLGLAEPPVILGHSFGSIVTSAAVASGLETPKLILINPIAAPALKGPMAALTGLAVFYYWLGAKLPRPLGYGWLSSRAVTRIMSEAMAITRDDRLRPWIHAQHRTYFGSFSDRDTLLESFRASTGNNVQEFAAGIHVPTLLIAAEKDQITPVAEEQKLRDLIPGARLEVIEGVGHLIHYERPREAAALIVDFLGAGSLA